MWENGAFVRNWKRSRSVKLITWVRFPYSTLTFHRLTDKPIGYEPIIPRSNRGGKTKYLYDVIGKRVGFRNQIFSVRIRVEVLNKIVT